MPRAASIGHWRSWVIATDTAWPASQENLLLGSVRKGLPTHALVFYHLEVSYSVQLLQINAWKMTGDQICYMKKYFTFQNQSKKSDLEVTVLIKCEGWSIQFRSHSQRPYSVFKLSFFFSVLTWKYRVRPN